MKDPNHILIVQKLRTQFLTVEGRGLAVDGVSFHVNRGETVALVGESGSGKSVTALSIMRLIPDPPGQIVGGDVLLEGRDLLKLSPAEMRSIRGSDIGMIFQDPMTSLNPVHRIGDQIIEAIRIHERISRVQARKRAVDLLSRVGIPSPDQMVDNYPHRLSGGQRQRAMIAMALSCQPKLLIADEPTTALDVTVQAQILELLRALQRDEQMGILLITHNLGVVAEMAQRMVVMYAGRRMEEGSTEEIFKDPRHPYTRGLLGAIPLPPETAEQEPVSLKEIPGTVPSIFSIPPHCVFQPRCPFAISICEQERPTAVEFSETHRAACFRAGENCRPWNN
jgi:peptide/nickel transport system ATP-binding protein